MTLNNKLDKEYLIKLENIIKDINKITNDMHKFGYMCDDYKILINNIISQIKDVKDNLS